MSPYSLNDDETLPMGYQYKVAPRSLNIGTSTVQHGGEFRGKISVWENGRFLWSKLSEIRSTTKDDAQRDAESMKRELLAENGLIQ